MSVNNTVASTRSGLGALRTPVKKAWISSQSVNITDPMRVILAWKLHVLGALDMLGNVTAMLDFDHSITRAMQDERGDRDYWRHMSDIYLHVHS